MSIYNAILKVFRGYSKLFYKFQVIGLENIPNEGNIVIAANHKSNLDPIFLAGAIQNRPVSVVAKKELFKFKLLGVFLSKLNVIPVDRENPGISTVKAVLKELKNGNAVGIFPEGTRCKGDKFGDAKAGLAMFAIKGKANVIPVSIVTDYKLFKKVTIYVDKPIEMEKYYKMKLTTEDYEDISKDVLSIIEANYNKLKDSN